MVGTDREATTAEVAGLVRAIINEMLEPKRNGLEMRP